MIIGLLLAAAALALGLYLSGLATALQFGDAAVPGFLLVPALPTPLYVAMLLVVLAGVGLSLLASTLQRRRRRREVDPQRQSDAPRPLWQSILSLLGTVALFGLGLHVLMKHGPEVQAFFERLRAEVQAIQGMLAAGGQPWVEQVSSSAAGYALFVVVVAIYGGMALLALWALLDDGDLADGPATPTAPHIRRVRRAMAAGLRELNEHADPRRAIIACYARLEHLLEQHGVPAYQHLTPQEYLRATLRGLDLPPEALVGLIGLFELARYSLHPLDDAARASAIAHLERLKAHLDGSPRHAAPA
jgi:hypothetical protein